MAKSISDQNRASRESDADTKSVKVQFLTFFLGEQEFGVNIMDVQELRVWDKVTEIPDSPDFVKGLLDLRGKIVTIVDLRTRFHMDIKDYSPSTVIVVITMWEKGEEKVVGLVVDAVSDVIELNEDQVKESPGFDTEGDKCIDGLASFNEKMVVLLKTKELMNVNIDIDMQEAIAETLEPASEAA